MIVESWTSNEINNSFLALNEYELLERKDRTDTSKGRGGGLLIYTRKEIRAWREDVMTNFNQCGKIL